MQLMRAILLLYFTYLFFPQISLSQSLEVKNVQFESDGKTVKIKYDLYGDVNKKYKIVLKLSDDNGFSYTIHPKTVTGDIGKSVKPGESKVIFWNLKEDFPAGLDGDNYVFAVEAELQKGSKWPYYLLGTTVAAGAGFLYLMQSQKEESPTTGSIIIDIPN